MTVFYATLVCGSQGFINGGRGEVVGQHANFTLSLADCTHNGRFCSTFGRIYRKSLRKNVTEEEESDGM